MTVVAESSPVVDAVLAAVASIANPAGGTIQVGDGVKPPSPATPPAAFYPYAVVYGGLVRTAGTLVDPHEDGLHRIQVTCVGKDRAGAEWLRDRVREVLLQPNELAIDGYAATWAESAGDPATFRDDDVTPPVFVAATVANIHATPAAGS